MFKLVVGKFLHKENYSYIAILFSVFLFFYLPFWFLLFTPLFYLLSVSQSDRVLNNYLLFFYALLSVIVASFISMSVESVADIVAYKKIIESIVNDDFSSLSNLESINIEFVMYQFIDFISLVLSKGTENIRFTVIITINVIFFLFLYRTFNHSALIFFPVLQVFGLLVVFPFLMRQALSVSLLLLAVTYNKKNIKIILLVVSSLTHFSSVIFGLASLFHYKLKITTRFIDALIIFSFIMFFTLNVEFVLKMGEYLKDIPILKFFVYKISGWDSFEVGGFNKFNLFNCIAIMFIYRFYNNNFSIKGRVAFILFLSALLNISFMNVPLLFNRFGFISYYMALLFYITMVVEVVNLKLIGRVVLYFVILIWFLDFFRRIYGYAYGGWLTIADGDFYYKSMLYYMGAF